MSDNIIFDKTMDFALRIVKLYQYLVTEKKEYVMSKQILRCGTSIGANVKESKNAQSKLDFINKMSIALKEADETEYWLELLYKSGYLIKTEVNSILKDCVEIIKLLTTIINTAKMNIQNNKKKQN